MRTTILFDPGIRSLNKGDEIIMRSAERQLSPITDGTFIIKSATHAPAMTWYQNLGYNKQFRIYDNAEYKFICGSNLLWKDMFKLRPSLNVNPFNSRIYRGSVLVGVGTGNIKGRTGIYTRRLYDQILSHKYKHSVRDEKTKEFLQQLGLQAINTGCPTMWGFTDDFCRQVPQERSSRVVFTLTDYCKDKKADQYLIDTLQKEYKEVYVWLQGAFDAEYYESFSRTEKIHVISSSVDAYSKLLSEDDLDYVGTRLHAGMFALQHKKRTIVIAVDHRVRDMKADYNIPTVERASLKDLSKTINSTFATRINIREDAIEEWKSQFLK